MLASQYNAEWMNRSALHSPVICRVIDRNGKLWSSEFVTKLSTLDTALEMFLAAQAATGEATIRFPRIGGSIS